ncbi:MAG: phage holin family protein [Bacteroidales bacterium]|nr:phage holin family protein [Bacteroidales bacterium]
MTLAIIIASYLMSGVHVDNVFVAILAAVVISLLNNFIRPILIVLTLPFTLVSMGLFLLVINAVIILLASKIVPNFGVDGFWTAMVFSLLITVLNYLLDIPTKMKARKDYTADNPFGQKSTDEEKFDDYEDVTDEENNHKNDDRKNLLN